MAARNRRLRPAVGWMTAAWLAGAPVVTVGCADQEPDQYVYCVDQYGNIIDEDACDDDGYYNGYPVYYWVTTSSHPIGYHVPASQRHGRNYVSPHDPAARARAGVPRTGRIGGTTISHSGGFGHGSGGSHSGGG